MGRHTIILAQPSQNPGDFDSEALAMDQIASLYEQRLAKENPQAGQIQYRAEDLFRFIDTYKEFVALVFDPHTLTYQPRDKEWIKDRLITHFSRQQPDPQPALRQSSQTRRNKRY
ncbi:enhancer of rudimentary [Pilobolus umbonatus]|nr:enhancer of rudimentary [Pilobolus umbonatus]